MWCTAAKKAATTGQGGLPVIRYLCPQAEVCPGYGATTGVQPITGTSLRVQAWSCTGCETRWAVTAVNPTPRPAYLADLVTATEETGRLRWTLRRVIALADEANVLSDEQLWARLLALAESCGAR